MSTRIMTAADLLHTKTVGDVVASGMGTFLERDIQSLARKVTIPRHASHPLHR